MQVDCHAHLLFGLDDGTRSLEESLEISSRESKAGISMIMVAYHNKPGVWEANPQTALNRVAEIRASMPESEKLKLSLICEAWLDDSLPLRVERGEIHLTKTGSFLLEAPNLNPSVLLNSVFQFMRGKGRPILCHPERNINTEADYEAVIEARRLGARIQIDAGAIEGLDGARAEKAAKRLLNAYCVDFIGSDTHSRHDPRLECFFRVAKEFPELVTGKGIE